MRTGLRNRQGAFWRRRLSLNRRHIRSNTLSQHAKRMALLLGFDLDSRKAIELTCEIIVKHVSIGSNATNNLVWLALVWR